MIVTFYSFKGGVGRSMALANVAELLAQRGKNVIVCDWDLEAPGLERFLAPTPDLAEEYRDWPGIMDLLVEYKKALSPAQDVRTAKARQKPDPDYVHLGKLFLRRPFSYTHPIPVAPSTPDRKGSLRLLTAGRRAGTNFERYTQAVQKFNWADFYDAWAGGSYIEFFRKNLEEQADIILIDSRTGVTEHGGVCTHHLADLVVLILAANDQNIIGTAWMADVLMNENLVKLRGGRPLEVMPIAARIEQTAQRDEIVEFRKRLRTDFTKYLPKFIEDPRKFFLKSEIPYMPFYSFKERLVARELEDDREENLYDAYDYMTGTMVQWQDWRKEQDEGVEGAKAQHILPNDVVEALLAHQKWLDSNGHEGTRAKLSEKRLGHAPLDGVNLERADLSGAELYRASLSGANLAGADLTNADLSNADLRGADLSNARLEGAHLMGAKLQASNLEGAVLTGGNLEDADLTGANLNKANLNGLNLRGTLLKDAVLQNADLSNTNLHDASELQKDQLGGTNLSGARLPESIHFFESLGEIVKVHVKVRGWFWAMLVGNSLGLLFCFLLTDAHLVIASRGIVTPIYMVLPILLAGLFVGFSIKHFSLLQALQKLPDIMPDGTLMSEIANLPSSIRLFNRPKKDRFQNPTKKILTVITTWILWPVTMLLLWFRYLPKHEILGTILLAIAALGTTALAFDYYWRAKFTMRNVTFKPGRALWQSWQPATVLLALTLVGGGLSVTATNGWVSQASSPFLSYFLNAHLEGFTTTYVIRENINLRSANMRSANFYLDRLNRTDFARADLSLANFKSSELTEADLTEANLTNTMLNGADLTDANLTNATLNGVDLTPYEGSRGLEKTKLIRANLTGADLTNARLNAANFTEANLSGADFTGAYIDSTTIFTDAIIDSTTVFANIYIDSVLVPSVDISRLPGRYKPLISLRLQRLVEQMNDPLIVDSVRTILGNEYADSVAAVTLILDWFDLPKLDSLTANGRKYALEYLYNTSDEVWSDTLIARAQAMMALLEERDQQDIAIGPTTRVWVDALKGKLDKLEAIGK